MRAVENTPMVSSICLLLARHYPKTNPHNPATIEVKVRFHPEISAVNE
jgi:hypothetical protein